MQTELVQPASQFPALDSSRTNRNGDGGFDGEGSGGSGENEPLISAQLGVWIFLGVIAMLFTCFASAYIVRRAGADWRQISLPGILWVNTAVLLASSGAMQAAFAMQKNFRHRARRCWLGGTLALGIIFLAGQLLAWRQLTAQGMYLPTNPHSSFFYILTGLHAVHLAGGILWLGYTLIRAGDAYRDERHEAGLRGVATYWHFLAALWLGVLCLLAI